MAEADPQKTFNLHEAKTHLSRLVDRARAGEEIIVAKAGVPCAKLVPIEPLAKPRRQPGGWPELANIPDSVWFDPLPEEEPVGRKAAGKIRAVTRLLLDTHAVLFWWAGSKNLGGIALEAISDSSATVFLSAASCWEIATKFRLGKLDFAGDPTVNVPRLLIEHGFHALQVSVDHALRAGSLPGDHGDPFDRLIAAQAMLEDMVVVTRDPKIAAFGCETIW